VPVLNITLITEMFLQLHIEMLIIRLVIQLQLIKHIISTNNI